jgi:hypothetical protein
MAPIASGGRELLHWQSASGPPPVKSIWRTIRGYIWWSYERGSLHYDILVTLILIFVFFSPYIINFKDRPIEHNPQSTGVVVAADGKGGFVYSIEASAVQGANDGDLRRSLLRIIEPIAGEVTITRYEAVKDHAGRIQQYKVWVER